MLNKLKIKSEFGRNVLTLATGTAVAQVVAILASPIITRLYSPNDFGVFALFISIATVVASISNAKYESAIMLPKKDSEALNICVLCAMVAFFVSLLLFLFIFLFGNYLLELFNKIELLFWIYFMPPFVFFSGLYSPLMYFNNRHKNYKDIKNSTIIRSFVQAVCQIGVGFTQFANAGALIISSILASMAAYSKLLKNVTDKFSIISIISKTKMLVLARKYKDFPKYAMLSSLLDSASVYLPAILIPSIFGFFEGGLFFLAQKFTKLPGGLIAGSISQVYLQQIVSNKHANLSILPLFKATFKKLFLIGISIAIVGAIISPFAFGLVFGEEWIKSGYIAQYLFVIFLIHFCVSPLSVIGAPANQIRRFSYFKYFLFVTTLGIFLLAWYLKFNLKTFLMLYVLHEYILYSIYFYLIFTAVKKLDNEIRGKLCAA